MSDLEKQNPLFTLTVEGFENLVKNLVTEALKETQKDESKIPIYETETPISMNEAVKYLGKSRQTLTEWRRKGIIQGHTFSGKVYFLKSEILAALTKSK